MSCNANYSCKITQVGTLVYHNLIINDEKWNYADSDNPTNTKEEIIKIIENANCSEDDLIRLGFVRGWERECPS